MPVHERSLPGVGHKYTLRPRVGGELVVVLRHSGRREVLYFAPGEERPRLMLAPGDGEARELGANMAGGLFQRDAVDDVTARLGDHAIEWHQLEVGSAGVGKTVSDIETADDRVARMASLLLLPRGEFNLVIAALALAAGTGSLVAQVAVLTVLISIPLGTVLARYAPDLSVLPREGATPHGAAPSRSTDAAG